MQERRHFTVSFIFLIAIFTLCIYTRVKKDSQKIHFRTVIPKLIIISNNFQESSRRRRTIYPLFPDVSLGEVCSPRVFWHLGSEQRGNNDIILRGKRVSFDLSAISTVSLTRVFDARLAARRSVARLFFTGVFWRRVDNWGRGLSLSFSLFFFFFFSRFQSQMCRWRHEVWRRDMVRMKRKKERAVRRTGSTR